MDLKDVENLSVLARIDISATEKESLLKDFEGILGYVKQIEGVAFDEESGDIDTLTSVNVWREDEAESREFSLPSIKEQFPDAKGDFLKVKKIL